MGGTPQRMRDAQGHEWPVTGYWCEVCGMPLHPTLKDVGVHVNCEVRQAQSHDGVDTTTRVPSTSAPQPLRLNLCAGTEFPVSAAAAVSRDMPERTTP
jgi:hypothetical protein